MLPDDYENIAQSIVATNIFGNNILQAITTKNYWDVVNEYKPLMHTWYVGLLMQFYVVVPLILFTIAKYITNSDKRRKVDVGLMASMVLCSLLLYVIPGNESNKFYYLPYRLYEFSIGGLVFYLFRKCTEKVFEKKVIGHAYFCMVNILIVGLLFTDYDMMPKQIRLLMIVGSAAVCMLFGTKEPFAQSKLFSNKYLALIGAASYSIFVWHQVVFALCRYSFTSRLTNIAPLTIVFVLMIILSIPSYKYIEKMKGSKMAWWVIGLVFVLTTCSSLYIYAKAGVIRDVPELGVIKGRAHSGMWAEYCDRGYKYDKDFSTSSKPKWYVIGNSFGRDFVNIIKESKIAGTVEVSYSNMHSYQKQKDRFAKADVVFISTLGVNDSIINDIKIYCVPTNKIYIIGEKNFGINNGQVYRHRNEEYYHSVTAKMQDGYAERNDDMRTKYPQDYIDLIKMVEQSDGRVRVFTDKGKFISQDCRHLTKFGAQYYANMMNWKRFIEKR